jgi:hypothetical protein
MYRKLPDSEGNVLGIVVQGEVSQEDVRRIQEDMKQVIADHGEVRMLVHLDRMEDVEPAAIWQDLKMIGDYLSSIERIALVADEEVQGWARTSYLWSDAKLFEPDELPVAWQWVEDRSGSYASS